MKIKSFNSSRCPWLFAFPSIARVEYKCRICFTDKKLSRLMFFLSALVLGVVSALLLLSVSHFILLSSWHESIGALQMSLKIGKLPPTDTLHCKIYPASQSQWKKKNIPEVKPWNSRMRKVKVNMCWLNICELTSRSPVLECVVIPDSSHNAGWSHALLVVSGLPRYPLSRRQLTL